MKAENAIGMQRAVDHADRKHPTWSDQAYAMLEKYISRNRKPFNADQVRAFATRRGLPEPPSRRAWGAVFAKASRADIIRLVAIRNFSYPGRPKSHTTYNRFWVANDVF